MGKKKNVDPRRASRKLKELLKDKPFGVDATLRWDDPNIAYDDWDGEILEDEEYREHDEDQSYNSAEDGPQPLEFN